MKDCKHVVLMDTSGSFTLAIKLPTQEYRPRESYKQHHLKYIKGWRKSNKQKLKQYGRRYYLDNIKHFKQYYIKNRKHILKQQKEYRNRNNISNNKNNLVTQEQKKEK